MNGNHQLDLPYCRFKWKEKNIVHIHFKSNAQITPVEQDVIFNAHSEFAGDNPHCIIYTFDEFVSFSPETRRRARDLETRSSHLASASVSHNIAYTVLANFYVRFNKPLKPFKNFMKDQEALEWLREFLK